MIKGQGNMNMKRTIIRLIVAVMAGLTFMFVGAKSAFADDCTRLGGVVNGVPECVVSTAVTRDNSTVPGGPYAIAETLRITSTGVITAPPVGGGNNLTLNIAGGLIMEAGSRIVGAAPGGAAVGANITVNTTGDILLAGGAPGATITANQIVSAQGGSCSGGSSGNVTLLSAGGDINMEGGSVVAVGQRDLPGNLTSKCPAGEIIIKTAGAGKVDIDGSVFSQSTMSGVGAHQPKGGGPITVVAGCGLVVSPTGVVSSRGSDPGADLVHIEGCTVQILGLVESTGPGHVLPEVGNRCGGER